METLFAVLLALLLLLSGEVILGPEFGLSPIAGINS